MSAPSYGARWPTFARQWDAMTILPNRVSEARRVAKRLCGAAGRYQAVEKSTGVPWYMIAVIHERESSQDWKASLAQGDPWSKVSTHVPRGRGPFSSWEAAAVDALKLDGLNKVFDWRLEKILYYLELYNGWGYSAHGVPSPYLWGGTSIQRPGKYVADGVWSSGAVDRQLGCAALIKAMMELHSSIKPIREDATKSPATPPAAAQPPLATKVAKPAGAAVVVAAGAAAATHAVGLAAWEIAGIVAGVLVAVALIAWFVRDNLKGGD